MANDSSGAVKQDPRVIQEPRYNAPPPAAPYPFSPEKGDILGVPEAPLNMPSKSPFKNPRDGK